jgi:hypothetical protein
MPDVLFICTQAFNNRFARVGLERITLLLIPPIPT